MCRCNMNDNECQINHIKIVNNRINDEDMCECGFEEHSPFPENYMYGQSYVPIQTMDKTFKAEVGLKMGTIFPELVSPYAPGQNLEEMNYLKMTNKIKEGCNSGM